MLFAVEFAMNVNERQIAISVLETLREDLTYAHLNNGSRVFDIADFRQYIYERISQIRTHAFADTLYGNGNGPGQDIIKSNGNNGKAHP